MLNEQIKKNLDEYAKAMSTEEMQIVLNNIPDRMLIDEIEARMEALRIVVKDVQSIVGR